MARRKDQQEVVEDQEAAVVESAELNADGLVPGQEVDWATLVRIEAERANG